MRLKSKYNRLKKNEFILKKNKKLTFFFKKKSKFNFFKNTFNNKTSPHKKIYLNKFIYNKKNNLNNIYIYNFFTLIDFLHDKFTNKYYSVFCFYNNIKFITPYISGFKPNHIYSINYFFNNNKNNLILSNLMISGKNLIATSSNTYIIKISENKFYLPSGELKNLNPNNINFFYIGKNFNFKQNQKLKHTITVVRGIAKNPIDHPNGGNSNTKGSFKTPWGKIAKKNK